MQQTTGTANQSTVMTVDKRCFVDTNVLLAGTDESRSGHSEALAFLEAGMIGRERLFASGQVFREYLVVATRPTEVNGLGLKPELALANISQFGQCVQVLDETREVSELLITLIREHSLNGKRIHDANIVATMRHHGLKRIRTGNPGDFKGFSSLQIETLDSA
jgi:predicted nucleic acid-binding protein